MGTFRTVRTQEEFEKQTNKCCFGYGLWAIGDAVPMGPLDAKSGMPTIPCPKCGSNTNPSNIWKKKKEGFF